MTCSQFSRNRYWVVHPQLLAKYSYIVPFEQERARKYPKLNIGMNSSNNDYNNYYYTHNSNGCGSFKICLQILWCSSFQKIVMCLFSSVRWTWWYISNSRSTGVRLSGWHHKRHHGFLFAFLLGPALWQKPVVRLWGYSGSLVVDCVVRNWGLSSRD